MKKNKTLRSYSKILKKDFDWDYDFLLILEKKKLSRMRDYFQKDSPLSKENLTLILRDLTLCINLINIILDDGYFGVEDHYININNAYKFNKALDIFYKKRIKENKDIEMFKPQLRLLKALHLYNKIREYRMLSWWD
jgi:hypothetical protein